MFEIGSTLSPGSCTYRLSPEDARESKAGYWLRLAVVSPRARLSRRLSTLNPEGGAEKRSGPDLVVLEGWARPVPSIAGRAGGGRRRREAEKQHRHRVKQHRRN